MNKITSESGKIYIGMDVSQKKIEIFLLNADSAEGHFLEIPNSRDSLLAFFQAIPEPSRCVAVLETGTHSHWQSRLLEGLGVDVIVAHARDLHLIWKSDRKTDRRDAERVLWSIAGCIETSFPRISESIGCPDPEHQRIR